MNNVRLSKGSEESAPKEIKSGDIVQFGVDVVENSKKGLLMTLSIVCLSLLISSQYTFTCTLVLVDCIEIQNQPVEAAFSVTSRNVKVEIFLNLCAVGYRKKAINQVTELSSFWAGISHREM